MSVRVLDYSLSPFAEEKYASYAPGSNPAGYYSSVENWDRVGNWTVAASSSSTPSDISGAFDFESIDPFTGGKRIVGEIGTEPFIPGQEVTVALWIYKPSFASNPGFVTWWFSLRDSFGADVERILAYINTSGELQSITATTSGPGYTAANAVRLQDHPTDSNWAKLSIRLRDYGGTAVRTQVSFGYNATTGFAFTIAQPSFYLGNHIQGAPLALSVIEDAERQNILASVGILDATGFADLPLNVASQSVSSIAAPDGTLTAIETVATSSTVSPVIQALLFETTGTYTQIGDLWQDGLAWTFAIYAYMGQANAARITLQARTMTTAGVQSDQVAVTVEGGSVVTFTSSSTGSVSYSEERNARVEAVGDTGWYRIELTLQDYARTCDRIYLALFGSSGSAYDRHITWNPTLRYGDWVARGKNWLPTTDIIGSWLQGNLDDIQLSSEAAPDGTLSAVDVYPTVGSIGTVSFNQLTSTYGWPDDARYTWEFYIKHPLPVSSPTCYFNCTVDSTGGDEQWWPIIAQDGGFTGGTARNVTSGPGYSIADDAEAVAIGTDGWWRYRFSMQQFDTAATIFQVQTSVALRVGATGEKITIWNPRLTVGNPADARGYFVSGPQNLLGDGSDIGSWATSGGSTVSTNTEVAPNGRLEADTIQNTQGVSGVKQKAHNITPTADATYDFIIYFKRDSSAIAGASELTFAPTMYASGYASIVERATFRVSKEDPSTSTLTGSVSSGPGYLLEDLSITALSNDWYRWHIRLQDYSGTAAHISYRLESGGAGYGSGVVYDITVAAAEVTTLSNTTFTPPSLGQLTTFGDPISYSWAKLRLRRGSDVGRATLTGSPPAGEPLYCTDTKTLYIGDGTTRGGTPAVKPASVLQLTTSLTTNINNLVTDNLIGWDTQTVLWGQDITHDVVTNNSRIELASDGLYEISASVRVNATGTSASDYNGVLRLRANGTTDFGPSSAGGYISYSLNNDEATFVLPSFVHQFTAGDYFELLIDRESAQSRGVYLTANKSYLYIKRIG